VTWRSATFAVWAALGLATVVLVVLAASGRAGVLRRPFVPVHATLVAHPWLRVLTVFAWAWAGWHFFAR